MTESIKQQRLNRRWHQLIFENALLSSESPSFPSLLEKHDSALCGHNALTAFVLLGPRVGLCCAPMPTRNSFNSSACDISRLKLGKSSEIGSNTGDWRRCQPLKHRALESHSLQHFQNDPRFKTNKETACAYTANAYWEYLFTKRLHQN